MVGEDQANESSKEPKLKYLFENGLTIFEQIGGMEACRRLSQRFHRRVYADPELGRIFPKNRESTVDRFAIFIADRIGGPKEYSAKRGKQSLVCRHAHLAIGAVESERWLLHMFEAVDEEELPTVVKQRLHTYFAETAKTLTDPLIQFYRLPIHELRAQLELDPGLATFSANGRSLLSEAASRWDFKRVQTLLECGAQPEPRNEKDHCPLYRATNALHLSREAEGRSVVEILVRYGANVNRASGPGRSTPLHMTARRGNKPLAEALLDAGADIESQDSKGETPLRRAVNCRQEKVTLFLIARGADPNRRDARGRSTLDVVRDGRLRQALLDAVNQRTHSSAPTAR